MAVILAAILIVIGIIAYVALPIPVFSQTIAAGEALTARAGFGVPRAFHLPNDAY